MLSVNAEARRPRAGGGWEKRNAKSEKLLLESELGNESGISLLVVGLEIL